MASCVITEGQVNNCQKPPISGINDNVLLYNHEEWQDMVNSGDVTFDAVTGLINDIVNATGVQAYSFDVPPNAILPSTELVDADGSYSSYNHGLNFPIIKNNQNAKNQAMAMAMSKVVAIVWKKSGEGEVYGSEQGMKLVTVPYNPADVDKGGTVPVELKTVGARESKMPVSIFKTDVATTQILIDSLVIPGV